MAAPKRGGTAKSEIGRSPQAKVCGSDRAVGFSPRSYLEGKSSQRSGFPRHQAFEFFKPVEDEVDLVLLPLLFLDHQEPLPIG